MSETVKVYGKDGCVQCNMTMKVLDSQGTSYSYASVTDLKEPVIDENGKQIRTAPIVVAGQQSWGGFNPDKLRGIRELAETPKGLI